MYYYENCPLCYNTEFKKVTDKGDKFTGEVAVLCMGCGLVFLNPRMDDVEEYYLSNQYSQEFRGNDHPDGGPKEEANVARADLRWEIIKDVVRGKETLLEIGCAAGEFVERASREMEAIGIDPSVGYVRYGQGKERNIIEGMFPDDVDDNEYDVICLFHALEHVVDPEYLLESIYDQLADDGVFVLEYPDLAVATTRSALPSTYFQRSHLFDFSLENLRPLLARCGFAIDAMAYRFAPYPQEKNVLLVCKKAITDPAFFSPRFASELWMRLQALLHGKRRDRSILKVLHIASHEINVGDGAITAAIRQRFNQLSDRPVAFQDLDITDFMFGDDMVLDVERINSEGFDLVLVGGGGTIDGHRNREASGTALKMRVEDIRDRLFVPMAVIGIGHNVHQGQTMHHAERLQEFVDACRYRGFPFSVRSDGSLPRLQSLLDDTSYIQEIPDPGFFVPIEDYSPLQFVDNSSGRPRIVIQIASDASEARFGDKLDVFLNTLSDSLIEIVEETKGNVEFLLVAHTTDDVLAIADLYSRIRATSRAVSRLRTRFIGGAHPRNASRFFGIYKKSALTIGMRGHSIICSHGLGIPCIAIDTHPKVAGWMEATGLSRWSVKPCVTKDDRDRLVEQVIGLLDDPYEYISILRERTKDYDERFDDFVKQCLEVAR